MQFLVLLADNFSYFKQNYSPIKNANEKIRKKNDWKHPKHAELSYTWFIKYWLKKNYNNLIIRTTESICLHSRQFLLLRYNCYQFKVEEVFFCFIGLSNIFRILTNFHQEKNKQVVVNKINSA